MNRYVIGDIHGNYKALIQCLKKSDFNYEEDQLIVLGDIVDGYPQTKECIDEVLKIKNLIYIIGNHDLWALDWMKDPYYPYQEEMWLSQGGKATKRSYSVGENKYNIPKEHIKLLKNAHMYYIDEENNLFVHGGFNPNDKIQNQNLNDLVWDRRLIKYAQHKHFQGRSDFKYGGFKNIFIGHTTTEIFKSLEPIKRCNVVDIDTGAGWSGKLTIMNVDTGEFFQSDLASKLYPGYTSRG